MRAATIDDIPAVVAVGNACDVADIGDVDVHEDWVRDEWVRPNFDPATDAWVVTEPGGEVVAGAYTWDAGSHTLFDSTGWVHPEHRGRGIGTALVLTVERRAVRDLTKLPAGTAVRVYQAYDADATGVHDPDASRARFLFEGLGYAPELEYLHMEIDVPDGFGAGEPPAGVTIRPPVEADDQAIVEVIVEAFGEPWDVEEARQEWAASQTHDPSLWLVALDGDETVGEMMAYVSDGRGQISSLAVREAWRRRGIAGAMLRTAFVRFRDRGASNVRLNVDRDNATGATRLYERAGMHLQRKWLVVSKTLTASTHDSLVVKPV